MRRVSGWEVASIVGVSAVPLVIALAGCDQVFGLDRLEQNKPNAGVCVCACGATASVPPKRASNDAQESGGVVALTGTRLDLGATSAGTATLVALRFADLGIPKGATITSAFVQFTASTTSSTPAVAQLSVHAEATDNAAAVTTATNDVSSRTLLPAGVDWDVPAWTAGEAGAAQRTPDIKGLFQALVDRPTWDPMVSPGGPDVLLVIKQRVAGQQGRAAVSQDGSAAATATLAIEYTEPSSQQEIAVCMPGDLNPNTNGTGTEPSDADLAADCVDRVTPVVSGLAVACQYANSCSCTYKSASRTFANVCNDPCARNDVASDCSNLDPQNETVLTTGVPSEEPVCSAHSPIGAVVFGRRTSCEVDGTATLVSDEGDTLTTDASGLIEFVGTPCPTGGCAVGMSHRLRLDDVTVDRFLGDATFSQMVATGGNAPAQKALLGADHGGVFAIGTAESSARGRRDNGEVLATHAVNDQDDIAIGVDWSANLCDLNGALVGTLDPEQSRCEAAGPAANQICADASACGTHPDCTGADAGDGAKVCQCLPRAPTGATVALSVAGDIVNAPPIANAGADQTVECNLSGRAAFLLDGTGSTELDAADDADLVGFRWMRGNRNGTTVGRLPAVELEQALGTNVPYVFRLMDGFGQAGEDTTQVSVVDTTAPAIDCGGPVSGTIVPSDAPTAFTSSALDVCDPAATAVIESADCYLLGKNRTVVKNTSCVIAFAGATLTVRDSGGVEDRIRWQVRASDGSGNVSRRTCEVLVVKKK